MPSARAKKRATKAPRRKVWVHTFYLLQPFVQFVALIAVMLILARCSPLAPSTDRISGVAANESENSERAAAAAEEADIQSHMAEINSTEIEVISQDDLESIRRRTPQADQTIREFDVKAIYPVLGKKRASRNVLLLPLSPEEQAVLLNDGHLRMSLSGRLKAKSDEKAMRLLLQNLARSVEFKDVGAAAYMVLPDDTMQRVNGAFSAMRIPLRVTMSIPTDDHAVLELHREAEDPALAQNNAALLASALAEGAEMAILLE